MFATGRAKEEEFSAEEKLLKVAMSCVVKGKVGVC